jgi:acyl-CoA synthetase (AMP-forming)/AMP-acid ligase II
LPITSCRRRTARPEKIALAVLGPARAERWSYARLTRAVLGMAGALRAEGLVPGDRVLLRSGNTVDFPVAFLGAVAADLVPVPTAAGLTEGEITRLARLRRAGRHPRRAGYRPARSARGSGPDRACRDDGARAR